jgi:hypothetical protein
VERYLFGKCPELVFFRCLVSQEIDVGCAFEKLLYQLCLADPSLSVNYNKLGCTFLGSVVQER